jgi:molybdenum cofactor guanylyltransferase
MPNASSINMSQQPTVTGLVLAGGRGTRMGGSNKGLIDYMGKPLVSYAADNLRSITDQILVCSNTEKKLYQAMDYQVIDDGEFAWQGPLAGLLAGLRATTTPYLAISACDQLALPTSVYPILFEACQTTPSQSAMAADPDRSHPTCAIIHRRVEESLLEHLRADKLRVGWWLKEIGAAVVEFDDVEFSNINYRHELI